MIHRPAPRKQAMESGSHWTDFLVVQVVMNMWILLIEILR
jgi:hypothetical protein